MIDLKSVKYSRKSDAEFSRTLRKRVRGYFKENNISRNANTNMVIKTIVMLSMYLVPLVLIYTGVVSGFWSAFVAFVSMGFGIAGIGMNVMHDAVHGAYSKNTLVNKVLGYTITLAGGFPINWYFQHNVLHHTYTNIEGLDEDIQPASILRFSPFAKLKKIHRLQHFYAWFFYGLMTVLWSTTKDFTSMVKYKKMGLFNTQERSYASFMAEMILAKTLYYVCVLVLPMILLPLPWWNVLLLYLMMHFISGVSLGIVFQSAHVVPESEFYTEEQAQEMTDSFEVAQLLTTSDFADKSRIFSWFVGGLNFQVVHHLFPNICHIHYKKLAKIVKETANEYNIPYHTQGPFLKALANHAKMLRDLGRYEDPSVVKA